MPETKLVSISDLKLYLKNYRTVRQTSEGAAVTAMVVTSPDYFWALTDSLLSDGYLPTENIIVLSTGKDLIVREGNRRVAALKLIHKLVRIKDLEIRDDIAKRINEATAEWKAANKMIPCAVYPLTEEKTVDRIVALTHGKGQKAGRDKWNAVARARHARDEDGSKQPGLDLLEKYIKHGKNISEEQATRWSGVYPLSVLDEAAKRLAPRIGAVKSAAGLATSYPKIKYRTPTELILHRIGLDSIGFKHVRAADFAVDLGIPLLTDKETSEADTDTGLRADEGTDGTNGADNDNGSGNDGGNGETEEGGGAGDGGGSTGGDTDSDSKPKSSPIKDPKTVKRMLQEFKPKGANRDKVATLVDEAQALTLKRTPLAFCFLLRSMFEVSAKAYVTDHEASGGPKLEKANGKEKSLADVLREITAHLTADKGDPSGQKKDLKKVRALHGAMAELGKPEGLLSVTSMNQLVHSTTFSVAPGDVAVLFGNIFPLLRAMNE